MTAAGPDDLTFSELRLASLLHNSSLAGPRHLDHASAGPGDPLAQVLADLVIRIDRFAAHRDIGLASAIRRRFSPVSGTG